MNKNITINYLLLILSSCFCITVIAQSDTVDIPSENVEVVKRFEATILEAQKKKLSFTHKERHNTAINYSYNVSTDKVIDFERPEPEIRPLGYKGEEVVQEDLHNGYLYGGYGTHKTINAGAAYHYFIEDWLDAGFKLDYLSSNDSLELSRRMFSDLNADAYLGYHLGKQTKVRLRGFAERTHWEDANILTSNAQFQEIPYFSYGSHLDIQHNTFEDNQFSTRLGAGYEWRHLGNDISDQVLSADLNLIKSISDEISVELPISYGRTFGQEGGESLVEKIASELVLEPSLRVKALNYQAKAGVQYVRNDSLNQFFPLIDINLLSVFSGIDVRLFTTSDFSRNSVSNLLISNPYFNFNEFESLDYSLSNSRSYNLQPSYKLNNVTFKLGLAYSQYRNQANFRSPQNAPTVEFISRDEFSFRPEVIFNPTEDIELGFQSRYNLFLTDSLDLYYIPAFELGFTGKQFLFRDKLELTQELTFASVRQFSDVAGVQELEAYWDLSLKARYMISEHIDVFVQGVNLFGQQYALWAGQPVLRQQIWGGLKFRF